MERKMKKIILVLAFIFIGTAQAAPIVINPALGLSGSFTFGGITDIGTLQIYPVDGWEITITSNSLIDIQINDGGVIGDEWALVHDGAVIPWTTSNPGAGIYFNGFASNVFLATGTHSFDFMLTAACCSGGILNQYSFSSVSAVPLPAAIWFFISGLGVLFGIRKFA